MDFHSLSRKELQTLCKKNKIPANITNLAMADALAALPQVEGLDEFLNPTEADGVARTPDVHHHPRTATRRKGIKEEPESLKVCSRVQRGSRANKVEVVQDSNVKILPPPVTPAVIPPSSRRRALPVSTRRKKEEKEEDDDGDGDDKNGGLLQTSAASRSKATGRAPGGGTTSVQLSYSTRRSVRLLEKNLSMMTLLDNEDMGSANFDQAISQDPTETQKVNDVGASLQTVSTAVSVETDELEVSSVEKNTECEEWQSPDLGSEIQLVSGAGFQADPQEEGLGKVNCLEAEPHLKLEGISETCNDSNEVGECCDDLVVDLKKSVAIEEAAQKEEEDNEAGSELLPELEAFSEPEYKDCLGTKQSALSAEASVDAFMEFITEQDVATLSVEVSDDASLDVAASVPMLSASGDSVKLQELEAFSEPENKNCHGTKQDALSAEASDDAFMEFTEQDIAAWSVEVSDDASLEVVYQCVSGLVPISSTSGDSVKLEELVDNQGSNEYGDNPVKNSETADEKDLASPEEVLGLVSSNLCFSGEHQEEELKDKSEHSEDSMVEFEKMDNASDVTSASFTGFAVEKDAGFENRNTVLDAENVTLEAEDLKDDSEKLESEELEEHAAGEETALDAFPSVLGPQIPQQESTYNANTLVDGDGISEEIAIPKLEPSVLAVAPVHEQKISDIVAESLLPAQSETKEIHMHNANMMKENLTTVELDKKSIGELKKMLKKLTLDGKSKCKSKTDNVVKEVEKKRTALQALPENRMTSMEAQNDG